VVYGPLTNTETWRKVLDVHNRSIPLLSSVDLNMVSTRTEGYSGAEVNQQSAMKQLLLLLRKV
jgi:ATP-dependent 26S proteasome regulatory subunit